MSTRIEQAVPEQVRLHGVYSAARARIEQAGVDFELRRQARADDAGRRLGAEREERYRRALALRDAAKEEKPSAPKPSAPRPKFLEIQMLVAERYRVSRDAMISHKRTMDLVLPRQVATFLVREAIPSMSLAQIGRRFGCRDHTTQIHAIQKVAGLIKEGGKVADDVTALRLLIAAIPETERTQIVQAPLPEKRVWTDADTQALIDGKKAGLGPMELSKKLGISYSTVFMRGKKMGLMLESEAPKEWTLGKESELIGLRQRAEPLKWKLIAKHFGCPMTTVRTRYFRAAGRAEALRRRLAHASSVPQIGDIIATNIPTSWSCGNTSLRSSGP